MAANNYLFANVYKINLNGPKNATTGVVANALEPGKQPQAMAIPFSNILSISEIAPGTLPGLPYIYSKIVIAPNASTPTQEVYTAETVLTLATRGNA